MTAPCWCTGAEFVIGSLLQDSMHSSVCEDIAPYKLALEFALKKESSGMAAAARIRFFEPIPSEAKVHNESIFPAMDHAGVISRLRGASCPPGPHEAF